MYLQIKYQPNIYQRGWYDMRSKDCNFHRNQTFVGRIDHSLSIFGPQNLCHLIARLNKKVSQYQLECNKRRILCNEAFQKLSQLLRVWYFMWALMHAQQVSYIGIVCNCTIYLSFLCYLVLSWCLIGLLQCFGEFWHRLHWSGLMLCSYCLLKAPLQTWCETAHNSDKNVKILVLTISTTDRLIKVHEKHWWVILFMSVT